MQDKFTQEREHFPILQKLKYFSTPSFGLVPDYVWSITKENLDQRYYDQNIGLPGGRQYQILEEIRPLYGKLLGCDASDIAYGLSSTQMYNILTASLDVRPGDNVVLPDNGFIASIFAWQAREKDGLEVRAAKTHNGVLTAEELCSYADEHTRVIAVNHVESSTGFRYDMEAIGAFCRERGIIFAVDAAQSAGAMEIDVERMEIDFLVGTDYKWMCHFRGVGFAYVRKELRDSLRSPLAGWGSDADRFNTEKRHLTLHSDARRYELGGLHNIGIYAVSLVIRHYLALGAEDIQHRILELTDYCYQKADEYSLTAIEYPFERKNRSGIVVLRVNGIPDLTGESFAPYGITAEVHPHTNSAGKVEYHTLRLGLHYFMNEADIDALFSAIKSIALG